MAAPPTPVSRRDRLRLATLVEIRETARQVLVADGVDGFSLRAVAREVGMTAPGLYRYFPSREDLLEAVVADLYDEVNGAMERAVAAEAEDDLGGRLLAASRTFRAWAMAHRAEFGLLFSSPISAMGQAPPQAGDTPPGPADAAGQRFGAIFGGLIAAVYLSTPFPVAADDDIEPALREQLALWCGSFPVPLPLGVVQTFLSCWIRLYGTVSMEVFGHLTFALADTEPMFEAQLREMGADLGILDAYRPPAPPVR